MSEPKVDRLVGSAVGAHLANATSGGACEVFYWRDRNQEVDFVVSTGPLLTAIEVKSGRPRRARGSFAEAFKPKRTVLVGAGSIPVEEFLIQPVAHWVAG